MPSNETQRINPSTEKSMIEKKVSISREHLFQQLIVNLQDGFVEVDLEGKILSCNKAYEIICGYSKTELRRMTFWDFTPKKWQLIEKEILDKNLFKKGTTGFYEKAYRRKDGSVIPIEVCAYAIRDQGGQLIGSWAFIHDLSRQKQREEEDRIHREFIIEQQRVLVELSQLALDNLQDSIQILTARAAKAMQCERVSVWTLSDDHKNLICFDLYQLSSNNHSIEENLRIQDYPKYFAALKQKRIISADDTRKNPTTSEFKKTYLLSKSITSMLDCAIIRQNELLGVIRFEHTGKSLTWSMEMQQFAAALADLAGRLFESNGRMDAERNLIRSEKRYRSIFESSAIAIAELDFSDVFRMLLRTGLKGLQAVQKYLSENPEYLNEITRSIHVKDVNPATLELFEARSLHEIGTFFDLLGETRSNQEYQRLLEIMKEEKTYYCKICNRELLPRDSPEETSEKPKVSLHHIDYQKNIAIRVCKNCHNKLHTTLKKHQYGYNNIIRRDGTKKGRLSPGQYPKKILD